MKSLSELLGTRPTGGVPPDAPATALVNFNVATSVVSKGNSANITAQPSDSAERMKNALTSDIPDTGAGAPGRRDVISEVTDGGEFNNKAAYEGQSQSDKLQEVSSQLCSRHDKSIVDMVLRDVIQHDLGVTFDDIASVANAKRLLNEAVVLPMIMPEFFTGIREPWKVI
jgi:SpoVK/Ycf46/Vps4 family AAA+-type ATPase